MKNKYFWLVAQVGIVTLLTIGAMAQSSVQEEHGDQDSDRGRGPVTTFRGTIGDYTPANVPASVKGPWQIAGQWSLRVKENSATADFSAALTMVHSDQGVILNGSGNFDDVTNTARNAHTHHITVVDGVVTQIANDHFRVTGPATITGNGKFPAPFGPNSTLTIDIFGDNSADNSVTFSNIQLTFSGDAPKHFGSQPVNGVVRSSRQGQPRGDK
jgi:hypothetical protein